MHKIKTEDHSEFLMILDDHDVITGIVPKHSVFYQFVSKPIESLLEDEVKDDYQTFKQLLFKDKFILNFPLKFKKSQVGYFNGYMDENTQFIFVLFEHMTNQDVLRKMMMLKSQQLNELHNKDQSDDEQAYAHISKLNSELLNSRRTIEKQSAELLKYNNLLKKMAIEDSLTGCFNRRHFYDYMREHVLSYQKDETNCLIMIDFNHFKLINDQFGHDAGDRLLVQFVKITSDHLKDQGIVFRFGGDEFILLTDHQNKEEATLMMQQINQLFFDKTRIASLAYGIVMFNVCTINHEFDLTHLVKTSDELMYEHKKATHEHIGSHNKSI